MQDKVCDLVCHEGSAPVTVPQILPCRGVRRKGIQLNEAATVPRAHHQCTIVNEADVPFAVSTRLCLPWSTQSNLGSHSPVPQPQGASERYRAETTPPAPRRLKTGPPTATALAKWETLSHHLLDVQLGTAFCFPVT